MMSRESLIFCGASLAVALAVCAAGFKLAALPPETVAAAKQPAPPETLPDVDVGGGFGKVSVIGAGMRSHPGVAAKVFTVLGESGINIEMISTSPIKISCIIPAEKVPDAVRALHDAFELGVAEEQPTGDHRPVAP